MKLVAMSNMKIAWLTDSRADNRKRLPETAGFLTKSENTGTVDECKAQKQRW
jgi:hypothetical protein